MTDWTLSKGIEEHIKLIVEGFKEPILGDCINWFKRLYFDQKYSGKKFMDWNEISSKGTILQFSLEQFLIQ